jgi:hypothetical protein
MIEGAGYCWDTVLMYPRPFLMSLALSDKMSVRARLVEQTLSGS